MRKTSDAQLRANARYKAANCKTFTLQLNYNNDADMISFLQSVDNKQGFLKDLIRQAMTER